MCDILYCSVNLPFYAHLFLGYEWKFGEGWCVGSIILAFVFSNADWMALALIALSRALSLFAPDFLQDNTTKGKSIMIIVFTWLLVIFLLIPVFLEVKFTKYYYVAVRS